MNGGYSGLRDVGDSELLESFSDPDFEFNKKHFRKLFELNPSHASIFILANFLAEYLFVYELAITERRVQYKENQLDWQNSSKVDKLAAELKEAFINAMRYYSELSRNLTTRFLENASIDWKKAAMQLHFFSRRDNKGYLPWGYPNKIPKEIYGDGIAGNAWWSPTIGMSDGVGDTRHRGLYGCTDPVKEPEKARVLMIVHMLLLEEARKRAKKLRLEAEKKFNNALGSLSEEQAVQKVSKIYEECLELWPFDQETYKSLEKVHKVLGNTEKSKECRRQRAALIIQNAWENYLRGRTFLAR